MLLRLAWASWDKGNKERSIEYWEILLDRELQRKVFTGFAYDELVRIYKQEGEIGKLVALCEKAAFVQPQDIGLLEELGKAYLLSGQSEKACDVFKKLTSLEADNPAFYCRLGEALLAAGKTDACEEAYRQAGLIDPDEADRYLFQAADLYLRGGHFERGQKTADKVPGNCPIQQPLLLLPGRYPGRPEAAGRRIHGIRKGLPIQLLAYCSLL